MNTLVQPGSPAFFTEQDLSVKYIDLSCSTQTSLDDYPLASEVQKNIVIYEACQLHELLGTEHEATIKAEFALCLRDGPGVLVIRQAYPDTNVIDVSSALFQQIVADEKAAGAGQGDHFGHNERIWNVSQKVCERDPAAFLDYYSNAFLALACAAWLGPYYQITAQMNTVKPASQAQQAQQAHRDYHLGFQSKQTISQFPVHAHMMSQYLTLQGGIAHVDMPVNMGPTLFLPHSQKVPAGYLSFASEDAKAYFAANHVQLPLNKGDMVFFSPALMHAAGSNQTKQDRIANLLQISSAFGRPMETVNRLKMIKAVYPELQKRFQAGIGVSELRNVISAIADGYSFPTNLDSDPPIGGNAPETAQQMLRSALENHITQPEFETQLMAYVQRQSA